jgi:hypothetical protein
MIEAGSLESSYENEFASQSFVSGKSGPGAGYCDGDAYHPTLEKPMIIQQTLVVELGMSVTELNTKKVPSHTNLALETRRMTAEQTKMQDETLKSVLSERNAVVEAGIAKKSELKRKLKGFRHKILKHLKEKSHPLAGTIMRCIDEGHAFEFMERYHGMSLPIEKVISLLVCELGSDYLPTTHLSAAKAFGEEFDDGRIYAKSGLLPRPGINRSSYSSPCVLGSSIQAMSSNVMSTSGSFVMNDSSIMSASLNNINTISEYPELALGSMGDDRPFSAGVRRLQPHTQTLRVQECAREYEAMEQSIIERSMSKLHDLHQQDELHPTSPSAYGNKGYKDVNNTPFLYPLPYSKSDYYDTDTAAQHLHTWNHNPVASVMNVAGSGFRSKSPTHSMKNLVDNMMSSKSAHPAPARRKGVPPHRLPKLPSSNKDLDILGTHLLKSATSILARRASNKNSKTAVRRSSRNKSGDNDNGRFSTRSATSARGNSSSSPKSTRGLHTSSRSQFAEDMDGSEEENENEDTEDYYDDEDDGENDIMADDGELLGEDDGRAAPTKHSYHAETSRRFKRAPSADALEQRALMLLDEGIQAPGASGEPSTPTAPAGQSRASARGPGSARSGRVSNSARSGGEANIDSKSNSGDVMDEPETDKFGAKALSVIINRAAKAARELRFVENYFKHHNIGSGEKTDMNLESFMKQDDGLMSTLGAIFDKRKQDAVSNLKKASEKSTQVHKIDAASMFDSVKSANSSLSLLGSSGSSKKLQLHLSKKDLKDAMHLQNLVRIYCMSSLLFKRLWCLICRSFLKMVHISQQCPLC